MPIFLAASGSAVTPPSGPCALSHIVLAALLRVELRLPADDVRIEGHRRAWGRSSEARYQTNRPSFASGMGTS